MQTASGIILNFFSLNYQYSDNGHQQPLPASIMCIVHCVLVPLAISWKKPDVNQHSGSLVTPISHGKKWKVDTKLHMDLPGLEKAEDYCRVARYYIHHFSALTLQECWIWLGLQNGYYRKQRQPQNDYHSLLSVTQ